LDRRKVVEVLDSSLKTLSAAHTVKSIKKTGQHGQRLLEEMLLKEKAQ